MKLFHSLIYPLLGGLLCLSCSDDEQDAGTKQPAITGEVTFGVDLTGFSTRVTQDGSSWNNGDKIGAYVLDMKTLEPATEAANVPYVCSEEGASVSFASTTPLKVQNDGIPVKFVAYYPYNAFRGLVAALFMISSPVTSDIAAEDSFAFTVTP